MKLKFDLTGQVSGRLTAIRPIRVEQKTNPVRWVCQCSCGNETIVITSEFRSERKKSCGCLRSDMVAEKNFRHGFRQRGSLNGMYGSWANCKHRLGNEFPQDWNDFSIFASIATSGYFDGACLSKKNQFHPLGSDNYKWVTRSQLNELVGPTNVKHGLYHHPLYKTWTAMWSRCTDDGQPSWENYGGRGITVCDRWKSFELFLGDMGEKPTPKHSIDRINNDRGYSPDNCRWATSKEQASNRRAPRKRTKAIHCDS